MFLCVYSKTSNNWRLKSPMKWFLDHVLLTNNQIRMQIYGRHEFQVWHSEFWCRKRDDGGVTLERERDIQKSCSLFLITYLCFDMHGKKICPIKKKIQKFLSCKKFLEIFRFFLFVWEYYLVNVDLCRCINYGNSFVLLFVSHSWVSFSSTTATAWE